MNFEVELERQMRFIQSSAELYDHGRRDEAVRIAVAVAIIFDETSRYPELPGWLKTKPLQLLSTSTAIGEDTGLPNMLQWQLAPLKASSRFIPGLANVGRHLATYQQWWSEETIFHAPEKKVTREILVQWARNTDGGAHIASEKHAAYKSLFVGGGWGVTRHRLGEAPETGPPRNVHLPLLRQIAFEVLHTPDLRPFWHPEWVPTHDLTCHPNDEHGALRTWQVMVYRNRAYTRDEWDRFLEPQWTVADAGGRWSANDTDDHFTAVWEARCGKISIFETLHGESTTPMSVEFERYPDEWTEQDFERAARSVVEAMRTDGDVGPFLWSLAEAPKREELGESDALQPAWSLQVKGRRTTRTTPAYPFRLDQLPRNPKEWRRVE